MLAHASYSLCQPLVQENASYRYYNYFGLKMILFFLILKLKLKLILFKFFELI